MKTEMLAHTSDAVRPGDTLQGPDALTQVLLGLRLEGVEYGRCVMRRQWGLSFPAQGSARFHFVAQGGAWLRAGTGDWLRLEPGDAVLLPRGVPHVLASAKNARVQDIAAMPRAIVAEDIYLVDNPPRDAVRGAPDDILFCGTLRFNLDPLHPLISMMPDVIRASDLARRDPTVPALLDAMEREVAMDRIGACSILARLADVVAASIIRAWIECSCSDSTGWVAAMRCPQIGKVLAAIHAAPEHDWSVPALADVMGASRSTFAEAFTRTVGESPAKYVAKVKMFQARRWMAHDGMRVAVAADRLGYDSEASFSRAYKRILGHLPSVARAEHRASRDTAAAR